LETELHLGLEEVHEHTQAPVELGEALELGLGVVAATAPLPPGGQQAPGERGPFEDIFR